MKSAQILVLEEMLRRPYGVRYDDALEAFGVDHRTLRRWLQTFDEVGIAIIDDGVGEARRLRIPAGAKCSRARQIITFDL